MKSFLCCVLSLLAASALTAAPAVHESEIYRRGNAVEEMGATRDAVDDLISDALAPPPDDSHKWFITVLCTPGCMPCEQLKRDFAGEHLRHWYQDDGGAKGWAFLSFYTMGNPKTDYRFNAVDKSRGFPITIIQPPKNGSWGPSETIVVKIDGYEGDAKKFSQRIRTELARYIRKRANDGRQSGPSSGARSQAIDTSDPTIAVIPRGAGEMYVSIPPAPDPERPTVPALPSLEEYLAAVPDANLKWLVAKKGMGLSPQMAKLLWDAENKSVAPVPQSAPPPSSTPSATTAPDPTTVGLVLVAIGVVVFCVIGAAVIATLIARRNDQSMIRLTGESLRTDDQLADQIANRVQASLRGSATGSSGY